MDSVLVRFKDKSYYVSYDDLLNKANDKLFAYEDRALEINAKLNGQTLMFNKSEMEDKLKKDIQMPTRMQSNLATENVVSNEDAAKILKLLKDKTKEIIKNIYTSPDTIGATNDDLKQFIKDDAFELIGDLTPVPSKYSSDWKAEQSKYHDIVDVWAESTLKQLLKLKNRGNIMTNEQKLRKHIREMIIEALKEGDPYGRPDEDKYLFKTDQDYLAGIQGESVEGEPSAEELAAKEKAAKEKAEKTAYNRFFSQTLAKFGYSGAASIPDEKKREFYNYIDQGWQSKKEKNVEK